jgi:hypothetical protein
MATDGLQETEIAHVASLSGRCFPVKVRKPKTKKNEIKFEKLKPKKVKNILTFPV